MNGHRHRPLLFPSRVYNDTFDNTISADDLRTKRRQLDNRVFLRLPLVSSTSAYICTRQACYSLYIYIYVQRAQIIIIYTYDFRCGVAARAGKDR